MSVVHERTRVFLARAALIARSWKAVLLNQRVGGFLESDSVLRRCDKRRFSWKEQDGGDESSGRQGRTVPMQRRRGGCGSSCQQLRPLRATQVSGTSSEGSGPDRQEAGAGRQD
jgi:hypothetical protein